MRIGLIADTHIPRDVKALPPHVGEAFKGVDLILHAGDIYIPSVLNDLETIAPVLAARGNADWKIPRDHRLKDRHIIDIAGFKLGLIHGTILAELPWYPTDKAMEREFDGRMDIIVFGDTHIAGVERYEGFFLVNPGSPTLPNGRFELGTVGLLEIEEATIKASIVQLSEFKLNFDRESVYHRGFGA